MHVRVIEEDQGSPVIIDLLVPGLEHPYVAEVIRGVEEALMRTGLRMALSFTQDQSLGERQWLDETADRAPAGACSRSG